MLIYIGTYSNNTNIEIGSKKLLSNVNTSFLFGSRLLVDGNGCGVIWVEAGFGCLNGAQNSDPVFMGTFLSSRWFSHKAGQGIRLVHLIVLTHNLFSHHCASYMLCYYRYQNQFILKSCNLIILLSR